MAVRIGHALMDKNRKASGGKAGEWGVIRYKDVIGFSNLDSAHSETI